MFHSSDNCFTVYKNQANSRKTLNARKREILNSIDEKIIFEIINVDL